MDVQGKQMHGYYYRYALSYMTCISKACTDSSLVLKFDIDVPIAECPNLLSSRLSTDVIVKTIVVALVIRVVFGEAEGEDLLET